jgi:PAS domain S-box-containing protein
MAGQHETKGMVQRKRFSLIIEIFKGTEYVKIPEMTTHTISTLLNWLKQKTAVSKSQYEQTLEHTRISERLLSNILENAVEAIILVDQDQNIISFNISAEKIFGYSADEVIGKPLGMLIPYHFGNRHSQYVKEFSASPKQSKMMGERKEISGLRKNGEEFPAEASIAKSIIDGKLVFSAFLRDITNRKRTEMEMQLLARLAQIIMESNSFDATLHEAVHVICKNTGWDFGETWILSNNGKHLKLGSACFYEGQELENFRRQSESVTAPPGIGLPGQVWSSKQAIWIPDITRCANFSRTAISREAGLKAAMGIPILAGDVIVAVMLFFMKQARQEDERMMRLISSIAMQLGTVFQHIQAESRITKLYSALEQSADTIKKRLRESEALAKITRSLSEAEHIGLEKLLELIATSARELISRAEQAVIHLLDEDEQVLVPGAVAGMENMAEKKQKMRLGEGIAGQVLTSGETINIANVESDNRFLKIGAPPTFRSLMVAPIISGERKLGTISVQSKIPYAFSESDSIMLGALGSHAAIALENARLMQNTQQALKETNALYHINQGLAAFSMNELLDDVVELLQVNFGYYHVQLYIIDPTSGDLVLHTASGEIGRKLRQQKHYLRAGAGIVGHAAETMLPFFTNNVDEAVFFIRNPLLPETKSEMAVPVKVSGQLFGILDIQQALPKMFTPRDLQLVSAVADQLALALEKAKLYEDLQTSHRQEKAMRDQLIQSERLALMGRLLASVSHELNNPLQAIHNALFLLKDEKGLSEQGRQDLEIILAESERMAEMIERLRDTYRPTQADDFKPTQINDIIKDVHALLAAHLRKNQVAFEFRPDPTLPLVPAVSDQIRQVVLNLFVNAVEAMAANGGTLTARTKFLEDANEILVSISDTGYGIAESALLKIFEPFITDTPGGTGLGLTISRDIVTKHRGRISAENNPGQGATFQVWLPVKSEESE